MSCRILTSSDIYLEVDGKRWRWWKLYRQNPAVPARPWSLRRGRAGGLIPGVYAHVIELMTAVRHRWGGHPGRAELPCAGTGLVVCKPDRKIILLRLPVELHRQEPGAHFWGHGGGRRSPS